MNLLLEIILKDRGSRENAFIRRNVLSVESEGGKKKNGQNNGRLSKSANNENPCSKLYRVYIYIYLYTNACDVQCFAIATPGHFLRQSQSHSCTVTYYA